MKGYIGNKFIVMNGGGGWALYDDDVSARAAAEEEAMGEPRRTVYLYQLVQMCMIPDPKPIWQSMVSGGNGHVEHE